MYYQKVEGTDLVLIYFSGCLCTNEESKQFSYATLGCGSGRVDAFIGMYKFYSSVITLQATLNQEPEAKISASNKKKPFTPVIKIRFAKKTE